MMRFVHTPMQIGSFVALKLLFLLSGKAGLRYSVANDERRTKSG
jgi:hypothetical protein